MKYIPCIGVISSWYTIKVKDSLGEVSQKKLLTDSIRIYFGI